MQYEKKKISFSVGFICFIVWRHHKSCLKEFTTCHSLYFYFTWRDMTTRNVSWHENSKPKQVVTRMKKTYRFLLWNSSYIMKKTYRFLFFSKSASSTVRNVKYYLFLVQKREPYCYNLNTVFRLFFYPRTVP